MGEGANKIKPQKRQINWKFVSIVLITLIVLYLFFITKQAVEEGYQQRFTDGVTYGYETTIQAIVQTALNEGSVTIKYDNQVIILDRK